MEWLIAGAALSGAAIVAALVKRRLDYLSAVEKRVKGLCRPTDQQGVGANDRPTLSAAA